MVQYNERACAWCRYGAFPDEIVKYLWRAKQPYNVSVAAETAALAAISNPEYTHGVLHKLVTERGRLMEALQRVPFLEPFPSEANFILCRVRPDVVWRGSKLATVRSLVCHGRAVLYTCPAVLRQAPQLATHARVQVHGKDAKEVKETLAREHGIMVRHYEKKLLDGFVRISVGRPQDTDALEAALQLMA